MKEAELLSQIVGLSEINIVVFKIATIKEWCMPQRLMYHLSVDVAMCAFE